MQLKLHGSKVIRLIYELWNIEIILKYFDELSYKWDGKMATINVVSLMCLYAKMFPSLFSPARACLTASSVQEQ